MKREFTVVYTKPVGGYGGAIVCARAVTARPEEAFIKALERAGMDVCSVVQVFHGKHRPINTDWSKL